MRKLLVVLLFLLVAAPAYAVDLLMTWVPPTTRADGTTLAVDELAGYEAQCDGQAVLELSDGSATSAQITLDHGRYDCQMRVFDVDGLVSQWSEPVNVVVNASPNSPQIINFGRL